MGSGQPATDGVMGLHFLPNVQQREGDLVVILLFQVVVHANEPDFRNPNGRLEEELESREVSL